MTMGDGKEIGGDGEVEGTVESGELAEAVGDGASTVAPVDPNYDLKLADLFRCRGTVMSQICRWVAGKAGMSVADAEDAYHDHIERVLRERELDFSRNPKAYLVEGFRTNSRFSVRRLWRSGVNRGIREAGFLRDVEREASLDPRVSAEQERKMMTVDANDRLKVIAGDVFKRMSFGKACVFFLYYVCGCSQNFIAELFETPVYRIRVLVSESCSSFVDQVMQLRQKEVDELNVPFDFLMQDGPILEVIRKVLLEKANLVMGNGRVPEYPLLRDLLESSPEDFMRRIDRGASKSGSGNSLRDQQVPIRKAFQAALVED